MDQATALRGNTTVKIDYVVRDGETPLTALRDMIGTRALNGEVIAESGPAGGNPLARVTGATADVRAFLHEHGYDEGTYGLTR